jgi:hypothetical protein
VTLACSMSFSLYDITLSVFKARPNLQIGLQIILALQGLL